MGKSLRIFMALVFVVGLLLLTQGQMAWAGGLPAWNSPGVVQNPVAFGLAAPPSDPGTVKPPPVVLPPISAPGTYALGGVCTFRVIKPLAADFSLSPDLLPFTSLGTQPETITSYLAGVCRAIYNQASVGIIKDLGSNGQVEICFASVPNTKGVIYVYNPYQTETGPANPETYTALPTTEDGGLMCAPAQQTGKYFLANQKP